jgi:hypothetical protein
MRQTLTMMTDPGHEIHKPRDLGGQDRWHPVVEPFRQLIRIGRDDRVCFERQMY